VVDQNNVVIIGHGRLLAAIKLGLETVPVLKIENLTETQIKKLRILDNKLNESERDNENLKLELKDLDYDLSV
jgi:ParB-like chromosome segregation protein Spo0J